MVPGVVWWYMILVEKDAVAIQPEETLSEEEKTSGCGETSGRKVEMENRQQQTREVHEKSCFLHPPRVLHQGLHRDANDATDLVILRHTNDEMR